MVRSEEELAEVCARLEAHVLVVIASVGHDDLR